MEVNNNNVKLAYKIYLIRFPGREVCNQHWNSVDCMVEGLNLKKNQYLKLKLERSFIIYNIINT